MSNQSNQSNLTPGDFEAEVHTAKSGGDPEPAERPSVLKAPAARMFNRARWLAILALILAVGLAWWSWSDSSRRPQYIATPGEGHVHTASVLPLKDASGPVLWLGTHDGLFYKELGGGAAPGWRRAAPPLSSTDVMAVGAARDASPIYAAGHSIGVQRSDDSGATWRQVMVGAPARDVHALAVDPYDPERVYIWAEVAGLFVSTNGGATWESIEGKALTSPVQVTALAVGKMTRTSPPVMYAATNLGLFVSPGGSAGWTAVKGQAIEQPVYSLLLLDGGTVGQQAYAGSINGVVSSPDGLSNWKRVEPTAEFGGVGGLAFDRSVGPGGLAGLGGRLLLVNSAGQVFASDDGAKWAILP